MDKKRVLRKPLTWILLTLVFCSLLGWFQIRRFDARAVALAESGKAAIAIMGEAAKGIGQQDLDKIMTVYDDSFQAHGKAIWSEVFAHEVHGVRMYDWAVSDQSEVNKSDVAATWQAWLQNIDSVSMSKFKLDSVEDRSQSDHLRIRAYLWVRARHVNGGTYETQARFRVWMRQNAEGIWRIYNQEIIHGESVLGEGAGFEEVSQDVGIDFQAQINPMYATPEWTPDIFGIFKYSSAGVSAADYDDDGHEDLFFCDGARSALYRNLGGGQFEDVTAQAGLEGLVGFNVALFIDFDNNGTRDLFLGGLTVPSRFYKNKGAGLFERVESLDIAPLVATASAADYDNDGDVDLYLGRYLDPREDLPTTLFYTRNSAGNSLLRNDGDFTFTDVTEQAGVREGGLTLGLAWGDYDADGDQDLYVANDFGRNALFRNEADGTFTDVTAETGTMDFGFGMSASFGDVDNDGDLDLYVSNVHSGQRWYGQAATLYKYLLNSVAQGAIFQDLPIYKEIFQYTGSGWHDYGDRMVKGNSLLINDGKGRFYDTAEDANANPFGWYWASAIFDYDNDGLQDVYAANGWITGKEKDDL